MAKADLVTRRFIDLLGPDGALALFEYAAGCRLYIPHVASAGNAPRNVLELAIGHHAAAAMIAEHGGETLAIPLGRYWRAQVYRERGMTLREIATKLGVVERTVSRLFAVAGIKCDVETQRKHAMTRAAAGRARVKAAGG